MNKIQQLISDLKYQHPAGVTTYGACANECGELARGDRSCHICISAELTKLLGADLAERLCLAVYCMARVEAEALERGE